MSRRSRPGDPKLAVAYIRVSTDEQSLGVQAQRAAIEAWTAREGVSVVAWHSDEGVSGGSELAQRPELIAALGELRARGAGALLVAKRDRLARDVAIAAAIEKAASASGARVLAADGAGNGESPADGFMRGILDVASAYERALIRARTKAALAAKRARGERIGEVPFGSRVAANGRTLEPNPEELAVIASVRAARAEGLTLRATAAELERRGVTSPRSGRPLAFQQVARILSAA